MANNWERISEGDVCEGGKIITQNEATLYNYCADQVDETYPEYKSVLVEMFQAIVKSDGLLLVSLSGKIMQAIAFDQATGL